MIIFNVTKEKKTFENVVVEYMTVNAEKSGDETKRKWNSDLFTEESIESNPTILKIIFLGIYFCHEILVVV